MSSGPSSLRTPLRDSSSVSPDAGATKLNACDSPAGMKLLIPSTRPSRSTVGPPLMPGVNAALVSYTGTEPTVFFALTWPSLLDGSRLGSVTASALAG